MRGRDIKRYKCSFADLWLIYVPWHFPLENDASIKGASVEAELLFKEQYPAVYKHLLNHKEKLSKRNRAETGIRYEWYALQRWGAKYKDDFLQQKIVYREISDQMNACLVDPYVYINNKCYMITGSHLIYLISIFNSTLFNKVILQSANTTGGKGFAFLENVHIPVPPADIEEKLIRLYNLRTASNNKIIDRDVDNIVYSLFGLSEKEIGTIESM